ncbi:MAG: hypothetical protein J5617_01505 [Bacilli bacterium]|nr:hypothetical protein [Bacilli bacterium]
MKKAINPAKLICGFLGLCTIVSIGGAISSTLAWYAYATRATLLYSGTSVYDNGQLQIGVKNDTAIQALKDDGMIEEQKNGSYYYFAPAGEGLNSDRINMYLAARGYATNELFPVTSGEFNPADNNHNSFSLKLAPNSEAHNNTTVAGQDHYSKITFAFRTFRTNNQGNREFVANQELWLTNAQTRASVGSSGKVANALRMYINRDVTEYGANNGFIFNPSSKNAGETKVAGLLNLGRNQYYDFDDNGEIVYGEYTIADGTDSGISNMPYQGEDVLADINGSGSTIVDTFTAKHSPYAPAYYQNLNKLNIKTAKYEGVNSIKPNKAADGTLSNPSGKKVSVCKTGGESVGYIGEFDATIYLEGWDFSVIDEEHLHKFDFQLRFETNRI